MFSRNLHWFIIFPALFFALWATWNQRPAVEWSPAITAQVENAKQGGVAQITFLFEKLREPCELNKPANMLWLIDANGDSFSINQRSGMPAVIMAGEGRSALRFEVPRFAASGTALVYLEGAFDCTDTLGFKWTVPHRSPEYAVKILGAENAGY